MKNLQRYKSKLCYTNNRHHKHFSAITNAESVSSIREDDIRTAPNDFRIPISKLHSILQLCARESAKIQAKSSHAKILQFGFESDTLISNMLINMYCKCGFIGQARKVFDGMSKRSIVSWNIMIGSYTKMGNYQEALVHFMNMQREGKIRLSEFTISSILCACAANYDVFECRQLHGFAIKAGMDSNEFVGTALVDVYSKCGFIMDANLVFERMPMKNDVTWSSMVAGFVQNELYEEALVLFHRAQVTGLEHNQFTISSVVSACAGLAALIEGKQVHAVLSKTGFGSNFFVASSLVDMYAKCGLVREAYIVFSNVEKKIIVLWNAMISGLAKHARSVEVTILFEKMQQMGISPNEFTYSSVLSTCGHIGSVGKGKSYFDLMVKQHKVMPNVYHYSCMVDILGRAGKVHEAHDLMENMPFKATASMWGSLLASCRNYNNLELAQIAARHLYEMEPENAGNHVLLSNIYAANKRWDEVAMTRKVIKESRVRKERGKSWIEIKSKVHTFMVGERDHPEVDQIYPRLEKLVEDMKLLGYEPETEHDFHDVEESRKKELLRHHSEKLAFTFGLMRLCEGVPVRIMKNLRICGDCHSFMKIASKMTRREVIVRDVHRFHHFKDGFCSCGEFW